MIENVSFLSPTGVTVNAALALPAGDAKGPAVVVLHEWWGLNAHVRTLLSRLADAGFAALAPDLYHGQVATSPADAHRLMTELQWSVALDEIAGAKAFLEAHPRAGAKVGVTGFCMGGAGALATACNVPGFAAAVMFYGRRAAHSGPRLVARPVGHRGRRDGHPRRALGPRAHLRPPRLRRRARLRERHAPRRVQPRVRRARVVAHARLLPHAPRLRRVARAATRSKPYD